ncbi:MAG: hypothetical protein QOH32_49 [Bradyrhizobium sp.]|jgi:hypothetical protein|nr:hypothetical protein [Bradyrhizobium sp.]
MFFERLLHTRSAMPLFVVAIFIAYAAIPRLISNSVLPDPYFVELSNLALVACLAIWAGYSLPVFDSRFHPAARRFSIDANLFHGVIWAGFLLFLLVTFATAQNIPILSAIRGASTVELDAQRGAFLKGRTGLEVVLPYLAALLVTALLPFSLVHLFLEKSRFRYLFLVIFIAFSVSFLVKSLFINAAFPLIYLLARQRKLTVPRMLLLGGMVFSLLYLVSMVALGDKADSAGGISNGRDLADFFKTTYKSNGPVNFVFWRSIAVPVFTAADTLRVFAERFAGEPLWGATSSLIASVFSLERVALEKFVFEYEFGFNELANSNAVFFTEAYANFRWFGVVLFSLFVGQSLRWFRLSGNIAFKALWMNYCFSLYTGGLIGTLLSNGYSLMFFLALFCSVRSAKERVRPLTTAPA